MPQHLKIEVEGKLVGWLSTRNKGTFTFRLFNIRKTIYNVRLRVPEIGNEFELHDVDTGVQRQPRDSQAQAEDFRDDFIHARRCIAGAVASSDKFLQLLREQDTPEYTEMKSIIMRLMTNRFDRGLIQVHRIDNASVNVVVIIGVGANRVPNSSPKEECELIYEGIDASGTFTQTERALKILRSIGPDLLQTLEDRASH